MPYKSDKQERLMRAVAHSPEFAKKVGISQSVGRKFEEHKAEGGSMRAAALKKVFAGKETPAEERKEKTAAKKAGMSYKAAEKKFEGEKYCGGGKTKRYADGGETEAEIIGPQMTSDEGTFKEAFATARSRGDETFTWKGKKYTTETAGASPKAATSADRSTRSGGAKAGKMTSQALGAETVYDRMNRKNREEAATSAAAKSETDRMAKRKPFIPSKISTEGLDKDTMLPKQYKKGGSVRGVGIAKRGFGCTGMK